MTFKDSCYIKAKSIVYYIAHHMDYFRSNPIHLSYFVWKARILMVINGS
jgi:hypothetical protein